MYVSTLTYKSSIQKYTKDSEYQAITKAVFCRLLFVLDVSLVGVPLTVTP